MFKKLGLALGGLSLAAGFVTAGNPPVTSDHAYLLPSGPPQPLVPVAAPPSLPPTQPPGSPAMPAESWAAAEDDLGIYGPWFEADYLAWWIKDGPLKTPLVTTGTTGNLTDPGGAVLLGNNNLDFHRFNGMRLTAGTWLSGDRSLGIEGSYFVLDRQSYRLSSSSDASGNPLLATPFINANLGNETNLPISIPNVVSGSFNLAATTRLQGWEINATSSLMNDNEWQAVGLIGFRALDLNEDLRMTEQLTPIAAGTVQLLNQSVDPTGSVKTNDRFHTVNKFYGLQVGGRVERNWQGIVFGLKGKLGLGGVDQRLDIEGTSTGRVNSTADPITGLGGIRALPTNIGRHTNWSFAVVPEVGVTVSEQITSWMRLRVGYDFLYWSSVLRPGQQLDRTLNQSLIPTSPSFSPTGQEVSPTARMGRSDFYVHGLTAGLEFIY